MAEITTSTQIDRLLIYFWGKNKRVSASDTDDGFQLKRVRVGPQ